MSSEVDPRIERTRRAVCQAALEELAQEGYGAFTIDSVARRARVARSTIYRHWSEKLDLISDAMETLNEQPGPPRGEGSSGRPAERVEIVLRHFVEVMTRSLFSECLPALFEAAERHTEFARFLHDYSGRRRRALVEALASGVTAGDFREDLDPELASLALVGPIVYRRILTPAPFEAEAIPKLMRTVLGGA